MNDERNPLLDFDSKKEWVIGTCEKCHRPVSIVATTREMNGRTIPSEGGLTHPWCKEARQ